MRKKILLFSICAIGLTITFLFFRLNTGTAKRESDHIRRDRQVYLIHEAVNAYAKACSDRNQKPATEVSVRDLVKMGFLKQEDFTQPEFAYQLWAVEAGPVEEFRLAASDLEEAFVGDGSSRPPVPNKAGHLLCLKLTPACADSFRQKTREIVNRKLRVSAGDVTVIEAVVKSEIPGPWVVVNVGSDIQANDMIARLRKSLGMPAP